MAPRPTNDLTRLAAWPRCRGKWTTGVEKTAALTSCTPLYTKIDATTSESDGATDGSTSRLVASRKSTSCHAAHHSPPTRIDSLGPKRIESLPKNGDSRPNAYGTVFTLSSCDCDSPNCFLSARLYIEKP